MNVIIFRTKKTPPKGGVFNLEQYGDFALFGTSIMSRIMPELNDFFRQHGFTLGRRSPFFPSRDAVYKFECTFSPEFKIQKIRVWAESCKEKPYQIGKRKLKVLNNKQSFKDPTAMAYFARIDKMETDLTARRPKPWVEFLVKYTYPEIYDTQTSPPTSFTICVWLHWHLSSPSQPGTHTDADVKTFDKH